MIDYRAGTWGLHVAIGWSGSLAPRALTVAIPNALLTFLVASWVQQPEPDSFNDDGTSNWFSNDYTANAASTVIATFTAVMLFILYNRSRTSYNRWWEGGTLLQKTRGEWFNAYSSIMAFTSTKPELQGEVEEYCHLLARLMSLLMCCGLQQVSPNRDRTFEIIDLAGMSPESMDFLNAAPDKVEVIMQWIQRSIILQTQTGVLPVAPPILSRAFQEVSRGIVNLQNARKIADFPYPYPLAQLCMILQLLHYLMFPFTAALALPRAWAVLLAFFSIFVLWCIHFNALDLEFPFGARVNDLPMDAFQQDWNKSIVTLLDKKATQPPAFDYHPEVHNDIDIVMSDASELKILRISPPLDKGVAHIVMATRSSGDEKKKRRASIATLKHERASAPPSSPHVPPGEDAKSAQQRVPSKECAASKLKEPAKKEGPDIPSNVPPSDANAPIGTTPGSTLASSSQAPNNSVGQLKPPPPIEPLKLETTGIALFEDLVADERSSAASNHISLNAQSAAVNAQPAADEGSSAGGKKTAEKKKVSFAASGNPISLNNTR